MMPYEPDLFGGYPEPDGYDEFLEHEEQSEGEEDLEAVDQSLLSRAVVSGSDWTTETIISQIDKGNILLNPEFQRRDAWDRKRKSSFIESLILGLPVPQIVLAESKTKRGSYLVLDGKQRLLTIRQFAAGRGDEVFVPLRLAGLKIREDLNGKSLEGLREYSEFDEDVSAFENETIRTIVIKGWPDEQFLYHVFLRLNTGSVPLSTQELRQALHPGPFMKFLDKKSTESVALREILKSKKPDFRMRDAELLLRFLAFYYYRDFYSGNLKGFLDEACRDFNEGWENMEPRINDCVDQFEMAYTCAQSIFGDNVFKKWTGLNYERRFNRSIFDVMMVSFSDPKIRLEILGREEEVEVAFKWLCEHEPEFRRSIESTTKSISATETRFGMWGECLAELLGDI